MQQTKKVAGERIAAAVIDSIIVSILGFIVVALWFVFTLDFENLLESFLVSQDIESENFLWYMLYTISGETIIGILYFVFIPWKKNGQTLGKMMLKIKAVDEYGENPTFFKHFVRAIQNWGTYVGVIAGMTAFISIMFYSVIVAGLGLMINVVVIVSLIMLMSREDGRGLHDLVAGTTVVRIDEDFNKDFAMKAAQMGEWADVTDSDDQGFKDSSNEEKEEKDEWTF